MARLLLLRVIFHGILFGCAWSWQVTMPQSIRGLSGSCLVIPCRYYYYSDPPQNPYRVVWYEYVGHGYPLVFDSWYPGSVIDKFKGKTRLYTNDLYDCSLLITEINPSHNEETLYTWIDPENVGRKTFKFYDVTSTIYVDTSAQAPSINIFGGSQIGQTITVQCSTSHTCPYTKPTLILSGIEAKNRDKIEHEYSGDGIWKIILTREGTVQSDNHRVYCIVKHPGGQQASALKTHIAACPIDRARIKPDSNTEFREGVQTDIICSVTYKCPKDRPYITWNGGHLSGSTQHVSGKQQEARSTLKFTPRSGDHGKVIACQVEFKGNVQTETITIKVKRSVFSRDWTFSMPPTIRGVRGSCVVIPCSFEFKTTQSPNVNVKWYQFSATHYPLVYTQSTGTVITKFRGKTSLYGSPNEGNCSLKIQPLELQHNQERLYPWMDPNSIDTYHRENYRDVTIALEVTDIIERPQMDIIISEKVGEPITLSCSVIHTCLPTPPTLSLSITRGTERLMHAYVSDGKWKMTKEITWNIQEDDVSVTCTVSYPSGQSATTEVRLNPSCLHKDILIDPEVADVTEGVATNFTCKVFHACKSQIPTITWNYEEMLETVGTKQNRGSGWITYSNVLFLGSMEDHGKKLTCTAKFPYGEFPASVVLRVQKYVPKVVDPFENDTLHVFEADVVPRISALTRSCVVIPCTFQIGDEPVTRLRGLWYNTRGEYVFHTGKSHILDNFKDRTKLLGEPDEQNCTLEIDNVQAHDNGPFCFHAEKGTDKYRFNHSCVFIVLKDQALAFMTPPEGLALIATPDKPLISDLPEELEPGKKYTISCSVTHTCSSHPPTITWSIPTTKKVVSHMPVSAGQWRTTSTVTYIPTGYEQEEDLVCTASFWRGKKQESATYLPVKRFEGLTMETIGPYILAPLLSFLILCGVTITTAVTCKKRARRMPSERDGLEERRSDGTASWLPSMKRNKRAPDQTVGYNQSGGDLLANYDGALYGNL